MRTAWLLTSLLLSTPAVAQNVTKVPRPEMQLQVAPVSTNTSTYVWPSGLRMALGHDATRDVVVTTVLIGGGYTDDPVGRSGTGRVFESAFWHARLDSGERVLDAFVSRLGCTVDGIVEHDAVVLQTECPSYLADSAMQVWAQLFKDPLQGITEAEAKEIAARQAADQAIRATLYRRPVLTLLPYIHMQLFPADHHYFDEPDPRLSRVRLQDLRTWADAHVVPDNVSFSILGAFPNEHAGYGISLVATNFPPAVLSETLEDKHIFRRAKEWISEPDENNPNHYWGYALDPKNPNDTLPWAPLPPPRANAYVLDPPDPVGRPFARMAGPVDESYVLVGWSVPPSWHREDGLHSVVSRVLKAAIAKNLAGNEPSMDRFPGCQFVEGLEAGAIVCIAILKEGQEAAGERVAQRVIDQLSYLVDPTKTAEHQVMVNRAKIGTLVDALRSHSRFSGVDASRASWTARGLHYANDAMSGLDRIGQSGVVTLEEVTDFNKKWITRERAVTFQVDPHGIEEMTVRRTAVNLRNRDEIARAGTYWDRYATGALEMPGERAAISAGTIGAAWSAGDDDIEVRTLKNGLTVVVAKHGDVPQAAVRIVSLGGTLNDPSATFDHTFGREMMGFKRDQAGFVGGSWYAFRESMVHQLGLLASWKNLDGAMWMLRAALDSAYVSFKYKADYVKTTKEAFLDKWYDVDWHVRDIGYRHALAGHRAGREFTWDDLESWGKLSGNDIKDMHRSKWRPDNSVLVVVVSTQTDLDVYDLAETYFGDWSVEVPSDDRYRMVDPPEATWAKAREVGVYPREGDQVEMRFMCPIPGDEGIAAVGEELMDRAVAAPWNSAFAQGFAWAGGNGLLDLSARVPVDQLASAVTSFESNLAVGASGKIDKGELAQAVLVASSKLSAETWDPMLLAGRIADQWSRGKPIDRGYDLSPELGAVTPAALGKALTRCSAGAYVAFTGDPARIEAQLKTLGWTSERVDWDARGHDLHRAADPKGYAKLHK